MLLSVLPSCWCTRTIRDVEFTCLNHEAHCSYSSWPVLIWQEDKMSGTKQFNSISLITNRESSTATTRRIAVIVSVLRLYNS